MKKIWIICLLLLAATSLGFGWWGYSLGVYGHPNNQWLLPLVCAFFIPSLILFGHVYWTNVLNDIIGIEYHGRSEQHFRQLVKAFCRHWNGRATNNLIFWRLTSERGIDLRNELLDRDNYQWLIEKLMKVNTFDYARSEHSHREYLEHIRGIILEEEIAYFKKETDDLIRSSGNRPDDFRIRAEAHILTELTLTLWTLGFSYRYRLIDIVMPLFYGMENLEREEWLEELGRKADFQHVPISGRDDAEKAFQQILIDIRKEIARKPDPAVMATA